MSKQFNKTSSFPLTKLFRREKKKHTLHSSNIKHLNQQTQNHLRGFGYETRGSSPVRETRQIHCSSCTNDLSKYFCHILQKKQKKGGFKITIMTKTF